MTDGAAPDALSLEGIVVRAPRHRAAPTAPILDVSTLRVAAGERLALLGPNGAGKTTLLQVAALLRPPDAGVVRLGGEVATPANARRLREAIALVFQDPVLFSGSVLANAAMGLRLRGLPRRDAERRATEWLERLGVGHLALRRREQLSGGEGQRVALARAIATAPRLMLLDEPFAALDAATRSSLLPDLRAHLAGGRTAALLVTHDAAEALAFGDRLAIVRAGRIAQVGAPAALATRPDDAGIAAIVGCAGRLPGVAAIDGSGWGLVTPGNHYVGAASAASGVRPGEIAVGILRGEVSWHAGGTGAALLRNAVPARVASVEATPSGWRATLRTAGDGMLAVHAGWDRARAPTPGADVIAIVAAEQMHLAAPDPAAGPASFAS